MGMGPLVHYRFSVLSTRKIFGIAPTFIMHAE